MVTFSELQTLYIGDVPQCFAPGNSVKIHGIIPAEAVRFSVNLQCGTEDDTPNDIALQVIVNVQEASVVLNSMQKGIWDEAQYTAGITIKCEEKCVMRIKCDFTEYKVSINEQHICEIPQKLSYDQLTHLTIGGDIILERISYKIEPSTSIAYPLPLPRPGRINVRNFMNHGYCLRMPPYVNTTFTPPIPINYGVSPLPLSSGMHPYVAAPSFTPLKPGQKLQDSAVPLNPACSNFRPVPPSKRKMYIFILKSIVCGIGISCIMILADLMLG